MINFKSRKTFQITLWILIGFPTFLAIFIFSLISAGKLGYMPSFPELENPQFNLASEVYTDDSVLLGKYFIQNRTFIDYDQLSPYLIDALITTEDIRFYKHSGIDFRGLMRALVKTGVLQQSSGGGSTITQQLAKLLYTERSSNIFLRLKQKLNEWVIAVKLERRYTKEEIITYYLNHFDFLYQAYGIQSASKVYFNTTPDSLKIEEAAMLVGMLKNPSLYNPARSNLYELALQRRNTVLYQMRSYKKISREEYDSLRLLPVELHFNPANNDDGPGRYFRESLRLLLTKNEPGREDYYSYYDYQIDSLRWINDPLFGWCIKNKKPDGNPYNIYKDGLKIYTTINYKFQLYAEQAVKEHLGGYLQDEFFKEKKGRPKAPFTSDLTNEEIQSIMNLAIRRSERYKNLKLSGASQEEIKKSFRNPVPMQIFSWKGYKDTVMAPVDSIRYYKHLLRAGFLAMDPHNGHIKAYVGGIDFNQMKFDHVTANNRQVGSTIKPFLYTLAMQEGLTPCTEVYNVPVSFPVGDSSWAPKNSGRSDWENKKVNLKFGLAHSINYISAWVLSQYNPQAVVDMARKLGVKSYIDPVYSVILGTSGISLQEMTSAYCVYANKGVYQDPVYVTRIEDKNGNVISRFISKPNEVISEKTAYLMINLMEGVVNNGTATRLHYRYGFEIPIAGKTGTTQNHSDGWFMGITPNLVAGAWVGAEDRSVHFNNISMGQGATMALPIWALFMEKVVANDTTGLYNNADFEEPEGFNIDLDCPVSSIQIGRDEEILEIYY